MPGVFLCWDGTQSAGILVMNCLLSAGSHLVEGASVVWVLTAIVFTELIATG
jgi:hypothetical protein